MGDKKMEVSRSDTEVLLIRVSMCTILQVMAANLRKQEFPASASQALQFIHSQV